MHRGVIAITLAAALALAACSDDKPEQTLSASDDSTTTSVEETTTTTEATTTTIAPVVTAAPATTTTKAKPTTTTTAKPTTTTAGIPADQASLTIVNEYPSAVVAVVNGVRYQVPQGGRKGPVGVKPRAIDGNDVITIQRADDQTCGTGGADGYFEAGGQYTLRLYVGAPAGCGQASFPSLSGQVDPGGRGV